jgi:tRNA nucleotidyltransferase/poly(A) polymerase
MITPSRPNRPLIWPDVVLDLHDTLSDPTAAPVYIVGGAVRDAYLGRPIHDLDLTTPGDPTQIGKMIANRLKGDFYVMDAERGVARALITYQQQPYVIDIAAFRGETLLDDLAARDFTINAMAVDLRGDLTALLDPLSGETDLSDKILRRCGPDAMSDDPLRTLRAVRLSSQFGLRLEPGTLNALREATPSLAHVSGERVRDEFFKLLSIPKPVLGLRVAQKLGVLAHVLPATTGMTETTMTDGRTRWDYTLAVVEKLYGIIETISPRRTDLTAAVFDLGLIVVGLDRFRAELMTHIAQTGPQDRRHTALLLLAALLHTTSPAQASEQAEALRLSRKEIKRLRAMLDADPLSTAATPLALHRYWYQAGEAGVDQILLALAIYLGKNTLKLDQDDWVRTVEQARALLTPYYTQYDVIVNPPPLLNGKDLMDALDLEPGAQIGQMLTAIREAQVTGDVLTRDDALALARSLKR